MPFARLNMTISLVIYCLVDGKGARCFDDTLCNRGIWRTEYEKVIVPVAIGNLFGKLVLLRKQVLMDRIGLLRQRKDRFE